MNKVTQLFFLSVALLLSPAKAYSSALQSDSNTFGDIKIKVFEAGTRIDCHSTSLNDDLWQRIAFSDLPQNSHFCLRANININSSTLQNNPSLLIGMAGSSSVFWDGQLISRNGTPAASRNEEMPGTIKTIVRIPKNSVTQGSHLLSAEISTFHVGRDLDSIGYILSIVDETNLNYFVLILSVVSAIFIGISIVLALIFQLFYWLYEREYSYQIFSVLCFSLTLILLLEQCKFWLNYSYDWHATRLTLIYVFTFISSLLLPIFYLFKFKHANKRVAIALIFLIMCILSFVKPSFDETSTLLFSGALLCALFLNLRHMKHSDGVSVGFITRVSAGVSANVIILVLSIAFLYFIPDYFTEFGFSIVFVSIVMTMLISLIKEMYQNKVNALKSERVKAELLRRNMQPQFLMNCLTQLMELIEVKPKHAVKFITVLADEFRQLTNQSDKKRVQLVEEIQLCNRHLEIMSFRYQQTYQLKVVGETDNISIPSSILHSQIENCFTHNQISSQRSFDLVVSQSNGRVTIILKTPIEKKVDHKGTGTGEKYIRAKLAEIDQLKSTHNSSKKSEFVSFEEDKYWVSQYAFNLS